jgi:tRNA threonylcarbamoyladenosine biosynthesis protein TsaB
MSTATHPQPSLLAFDTSTERMAVALVCAAGVFTHDGPGGAQASAGLLPQAHALLRQAGVDLRQLQAIAFGQGPGAFTGLRTSCAVAQGLAFGLGCPVLPLDSLQLVAEDALAQAVDCSGMPPDGCELAVAMDARMDEAYAARYRRSGSGWQVLDAPALYTLPALAQAWSLRPPAWVAGSAVTAFAGRLPLPPAAQCVPVERSRAAALARLAVAAWGAQAAIDPALALPTYLRDKVALTTAERQAVCDAAAQPGTRAAHP